VRTPPFNALFLTHSGLIIGKCYEWRDSCSAQGGAMQHDVLRDPIRSSQDDQLSRLKFKTQYNIMRSAEPIPLGFVAPSARGRTTAKRSTS
jgi:hypothetical protein